MSTKQQLETHQKHAVQFVTVTARSRDYHAAINGDDTLWGAGKSEYEAIGMAVMTHCEIKRQS